MIRRSFSPLFPHLSKQPYYLDILAFCFTFFPPPHLHAAHWSRFLICCVPPRSFTPASIVFYSNLKWIESDRWSTVLIITLLARHVCTVR